MADFMSRFAAAGRRLIDVLFFFTPTRRRARLLAEPFPDRWLDHLRKNVTIYSFLTPAEQSKLRDDLRVFAAEKNWEGCNGFVVTDEVKVTIAAQACVLTLNLDPDDYANVVTVLVYPTGFRVRDERPGFVASDLPVLGQAVYRGPVILAWDQVLAGGRNHRDGRNVVFHEFAHQLDFLDGLSDGTPLLENTAQYRRWHVVMTAEYEQLVRDSERGRATLIDDYGATNPAEFFAVATECFFEQPVEMRRRHPALYDILREYYRQDSAGRFAGLSRHDV